MADLNPKELQVILEKLDALCQQAQELQQQIRLQMADAARRDYPHPGPTEHTVSQTVSGGANPFGLHRAPRLTNGFPLHNRRRLSAVMVVLETIVAVVDDLSR